MNRKSFFVQRIKTKKILIVALFVLAIFSYLTNLDLYATKRIPLEWEKGEGISIYKLEIAKDKDFSEIVDVKQVKENFVNVFLEPGVYYLRVAGISSDGVQGYYSDTRIIEIKPQKKEKAPEINPSKIKTTVEKPKEKTEKAKEPKVAETKKKEPERGKPIQKGSTPNPYEKGIMSHRAVWDPVNQVFVHRQYSSDNGNGNGNGKEQKSQK